MSKFDLYPRPQWLRLGEESWLLPGRVGIAIRENRLRASRAVARLAGSARGARRDHTRACRSQSRIHARPPQQCIAQITLHYTAAGLPGQISLLGLAAVS